MFCFHFKLKLSQIKRVIVIAIASIKLAYIKLKVQKPLLKCYFQLGMLLPLRRSDLCQIDDIDDGKYFLFLYI